MSRALHGGDIEGEFVDRVKMGWLFGWTGGMFGFYAWRLALTSCYSVAFGPVVPWAVFLMQGKRLSPYFCFIVNAHI